ncbi:MAG: adenosylcobinamide-GDP ribazoletransferase [Staphylococcus sp.]|nr:adenosylcobinamide-GDP ribazoletransferase [Staphylococcus sp.]
MKQIAAAFILFTRLPLWRYVTPSQTDYSVSVSFWPLVGWLTAGAMALVILGGSIILPFEAAVVMALVARLLLTGALHEDGLADFCDGFGCGGDRSRILEIMKDSHIGTYGVIGLICHILLTFSLLSAMQPLLCAAAIFASDPFSKLCAGQITNYLPYARPEGAKNKISYSPMTAGRKAFQLLVGLLPLLPLLSISPLFGVAVVMPIATLLFLSRLMIKKIGGYTGDCCGATFLLCELSMLTGIAIINHTLIPTF